MSANNLKLVKDHADSTAEQPRETIILTSAPEPFKEAFWSEMNQSVFIFSSPNRAMKHIVSSEPYFLFCDYAGLEGDMSGFRFAKDVGDYRRSEGSKYPQAIYLMTVHNRAQGINEAWALKLGALGVIQRSPDAVVEVMHGAGAKLPRETRSSIELSDKFQRYDAALIKVLGIAAQFYIDEARTQFRQGIIKGEKEYAGLFMANLDKPDGAKLFMRYVEQGDPHLKKV